MKKPKYQVAKYVPLSDVVPENWKSWFYEILIEGAPFSWGDNNRSLVDPISFGHHAEEVLDTEESFGNKGNITKRKYKSERKAFFNLLTDLEKNRIYIDLEN